MGLYEDAKLIWERAIASALPDAAVARALEEADFSGGKLVLVAAGKAAWQMAKVASDRLGNRIDSGVVVTKYGHAGGDLPGLEIWEAGHPVPDENSFRATERAVNAVKGLGEGDHVLFLLSGGGSALFEQPICTPEQLQDITGQLLQCGADIVEINTIRKRLSKVKGGRFAQLCAPAKVFSVVLSDIVGDPLDMIASGPAYPDSSTCEEALGIAEKYGLRLEDGVKKLLGEETPKELGNVETHITGSVRQLCASAQETCRELGYRPLVLTDRLTCIARDAGALLAGLAAAGHIADGPIALIAGGETVVKLTGKGLGGRNQELALAAAKGLEGRKGAALFSIGSDGTDGPTDAAGGYVDGQTAARLRQLGLEIDAVLADNDSYHALEKVDGLIRTGATGTNVNDLAVLLVRPELG
ncbi:MAG: glycerate kinase [Oscillospiraceae bacterium]|jgi:glycerate 2-kinase|nr:glycerate kinase [Oscillospiraceae bacterium]